MQLSRLYKFFVSIMAIAIAGIFGLSASAAQAQACLYYAYGPNGPVCLDYSLGGNLQTMIPYYFSNSGAGMGGMYPGYPFMAAPNSNGIYNNPGLGGYLSTPLFNNSYSSPNGVFGLGLNNSNIYYNPSGVVPCITFVCDGHIQFNNGSSFY